MKNWLKLAAAAAVLGAAPAHAAPAKKAATAAAPAARDWTRIVAPTPEGGFRIGNPAAAVKLVEYASFTCPHCAKFSAEGLPVILRDYVGTGKLSFEFRNFVRDPADMAAALIARCASPANFFPLAERILATQDQWIAKIQTMTPEQVKQIDALPVPQRMVRFATLAGLTALGAQNGLPAAKAQQCLTSKEGLDKLVAMREQAANRHSVRGTPSFILNGKNVEVYDWTTLKPLLKLPAG